MLTIITRRAHACCPSALARARRPPTAGALATASPASSILLLPCRRWLSAAVAPATATVASPLPPPAPSFSSSAKKPKKSTLRVVRASSAGWEVVVGIEVHAQIAAASKLFSGASTQFGAVPNAQACLVDAASPGTLPVLNEFSVAQAIRTGLGLGGQVQRVSKFERKHYFYADMPQGYQITQQQYPIVRGGSLSLSTGSDAASTSSAASSSAASAARSVRITRIQLEQDSGKSLHDLHPTRSFVDLNRAGVGLMEIVSEPDIRTSDEAVVYIRKLSALLQSLGTCRAHMEDGSLRADVNVSIRRPGGDFGERVEVKNLNSLRSLQRAIEHEVARQIALAEAGQPVRRETRSFDAKTGTTALLRAKEQLLDYRFAPEPDLPPLILHADQIATIRSALPELPDARATRFRTSYGLSAYDAGVLLSEPGASDFMDRLVYGEQGWNGTKATTTKGAADGQTMIRAPKKCANWLANELFGRLKKMKHQSTNSSSSTGDDDLDVDDGFSDSSSGGSFAGAGSRGPTLAASPVSSSTLGELIDLVESGQISGKVGKEVLDLLMKPQPTPEGGATVPAKTPQQIVRENGWLQVTDDTLIDRLCAEVLTKFPEEVAGVLAGNKRLFGFLSGQVLKLAATQGQSGQLNPSAVSKRMTQMIEDKRTSS